MESITNKVAESGIITLDLSEFYPQGTRAVVDIAPALWQGAVLKESDFRNWVKEKDWSQYKDQYVAVYCSADAIIPNWAYMLLASALTPVARKVVFGNGDMLEQQLFSESLAKIIPADFKDARVVVKGCGDKEVPPSAYLEIAVLLTPFVRTLMFGEPCSTVPVYKRK